MINFILFIAVISFLWFTVYGFTSHKNNKPTSTMEKVMIVVIVFLSLELFIIGCKYKALNHHYGHKIDYLNPHKSKK